MAASSQAGPLGVANNTFGSTTSSVRMCFGSGVTFSQLAALVDALEVTSPSFFWELVRLDPERTVDGVANECSETRRSLRCLAASKAAATTCSDWRAHATEEAYQANVEYGTQSAIRNYYPPRTLIEILETFQLQSTQPLHQERHILDTYGRLSSNHPAESLTNVTILSQITHHHDWKQGMGLRLKAKTHPIPSTWSTFSKLMDDGWNYAEYCRITQELRSITRSHTKSREVTRSHAESRGVTRGFVNVCSLALHSQKRGPMYVPWPYIHKCSHAESRGVTRSHAESRDKSCAVALFSNSKTFNIVAQWSHHVSGGQRAAKNIF